MLRAGVQADGQFRNQEAGRELVATWRWMQYLDDGGSTGTGSLMAWSPDAAALLACVFVFYFSGFGFLLLFSILDFCLAACLLACLLACLFVLCLFACLLDCFSLWQLESDR